jgi:hypothetical protein
MYLLIRIVDGAARVLSELAVSDGELTPVENASAIYKATFSDCQFVEIRGAREHRHHRHRNAPADSDAWRGRTVNR